jgi:hypothetical protein
MTSHRTAHHPRPGSRPLEQDTVDQHTPQPTVRETRA